MSTFIAGAFGRDVNRGSFAHLTDATVLSLTGGGVTFDADLDPELCREIWEWMTARDDVNQAERAVLWAARAAAAAPADPEDLAGDVAALRALVLADFDYRHRPCSTDGGS